MPAIPARKLNLAELMKKKVSAPTRIPALKRNTFAVNAKPKSHQGSY